MYRSSRYALVINSSGGKAFTDRVIAFLEFDLETTETAVALCLYVTNGSSLRSHLLVVLVEELHSLSAANR